MDNDIDKEINTLRNVQATASQHDVSRAYEELLNKYEQALKRIQELETQVAGSTQSKIPSKDDVEAISGMLDLINKLDESTIEKLNKFGNMK